MDFYVLGRRAKILGSSVLFVFVLAYRYIHMSSVLAIDWKNGTYGEDTIAISQPW